MKDIFEKMSSLAPIPPARYRVVNTEGFVFAPPKENKSSSSEEVERLLEKPKIFIVNRVKQLRCYASGYGNLVIFNMHPADVNYLNNLTFQMARLANISSGSIEYLDDNGIIFFPYDRQTRIFNRFCEPIMKMDYINCFNGFVSLHLKGLKIDRDGSRIRLYATVHQVKIITEDDTEESCCSDCIFS